MALTPEQLAELQRLKQMFTPLAQKAQRQSQLSNNNQRYIPPQNKDVGGVIRSLATPNNISRLTDVPYINDAINSAKAGNYGNLIGSVANTLMPTSAALATYSPELNQNEDADLNKARYAQGHFGRVQKTWGNGMAKGGNIDAKNMSLMNKGGLEKFLKDSEIKHRVYHGTVADINKFKMPKKSVGIWASRNPKVASEYATIAARGSGNPAVYPLHVQLKNPASEKEFSDAWDEAAKDSSRLGWDTHDQRHREILQGKGFDGAILGDSVVVFHPNQLKSAVGNRGTYDRRSMDITKAKGGLAHMADGGRKELEDYIRQREGQYGLQRLQRAQDEIPNLHSMYTYDALRSAFGGDNAQALMTMNPADFEKFALRLGSEEDESAYEGGMTRAQYLAKLARIASTKGFDDVPFLDVGRRKPEYLPSIQGHEGRHRSRALSNINVLKSLVKLYPTPSMREDMPRRHREDFIEAMKKELGEKRFVTPEGRSLLPADLMAQEHRNLENRGLLAANRPQLPDIYSRGGRVTHAHHLEIEERPL